MFKRLIGQKKNKTQKQQDITTLPGSNIGMTVSQEQFDAWQKMYEEVMEVLYADPDAPVHKSRPRLDNIFQQEWYEAKYGIRIRAQRPHEFAIALVIRPFSKPSLPHEIPIMAASEFAPGYHFIGLEKEGSRMMSADKKSRRHSVRHIRTQNDLAKAIARIHARKGSELSFFEASDELWQAVVLEFARLATVIIADVSESTPGLEWEIKELVQRYREKFLYYAIDPAESPFGPFKSKLPPKVNITPIIPKLHQATVSDSIFSKLVYRRQEYDGETSVRILRPLIGTRSWATDYWSGLMKLSEGELGAALERLVSAWDSSASTGDWPLCVYPTIALADAMTWAGMRQQRRKLLLSLFGHDEESRYSGKSDIEMIALDVELIKKVLKLSDLYTDLPLAIWQYTPLLRRGLITDVYLHYTLAVTDITLHQRGVSLNESKHRIRAGDSLERTEIMIKLGYAEYAIKVSEAFKYYYGEIQGLLFAAEASYCLGDAEKQHLYAKRGLRLSIEQGDHNNEIKFRILNSTVARASDPSVHPHSESANFEVIYTGQLRKVEKRKTRRLKVLFDTWGFPPKSHELFWQEARFRQGAKDYWFPVREDIIEDMAEQVRKGATITIRTLIATELSQADSFEVVVVDGFSKQSHNPAGMA